MDKVRRFFESKGGKSMAMVIIAVGAVAIYFSIRGSFGTSDAGKMARERVFICSETGKSFEHTLVEKEMVPVKSPHTGKNTGYPAELCFWTKDGQAKTEPTAVLLKMHLGEKGPTFCKDCGRLVVFHNPRPDGNRKPPETEAEYKPRGERSRDQ